MKTNYNKVFFVQEARGLPHTPTHKDSPEPRSEFPRLVEKPPAEEEEKEEEEVTTAACVEEKVGCGAAEVVWKSVEFKAGAGGGAVW